MGEVIEMPARGRPKGETREAFQEAIALTDRGELNGAILITDTTEGTRFLPLGICKERLQIGMLAAIRGLFHMAEEVAASGTAGNTPGSGQIDLRWPKRTLPKRLREASIFGDLT